MRVCTRCYMITSDPCCNDTESYDCKNLKRPADTGPSPTRRQVLDLVKKLRSREPITVIDRQNMIRIIEEMKKEA